MGHGVPPRGGRPLLVLYFLPLPEQGDDRGHEPVFAAGAFGSLVARAAGPGRPRTPTPAAPERCRRRSPRPPRPAPAPPRPASLAGTAAPRRPEAVVPGGGQQRPGLVPVEGHPVRVG